MEREPDRPNKYDELKKAQEAALASEKSTAEKQTALTSSNAIEDEPSKPAHTKELRAEAETGRIFDLRADNAALVAENVKRQGDQRPQQEAQKPEATNFDLRSDNAALVAENAKQQTQQRGQETQNRETESEYQPKTQQPLRDLEQPQAEPETTKPEGHPGGRSTRGPQRGGMAKHFEWAVEEAKRNNEEIRKRRPQQQNVPENDKPQVPPPEQQKPEPGREQPDPDATPPEKNQADWRRMISDPDYRRQVEEQEREIKAPQREHTPETPQHARTGDQPEKEADENEIDWRRALTDPDYSRQARAQERAELQERAGEQLQDPKQETKEPQRQQTQETPQPTRPIGDQLEKKASEEEFDWRRALTDPDYSREIRAQERAEQQERAAERRQEEGLQRSPSGQEL